METVAPKRCDTLVGALAAIAAAMGADALLNPQRLGAVLRDYLPNKDLERNTLKNAFGLSIPEILKGARGKPQRRAAGSGCTVRDNVGG
ncbi:hypothetical protein [Paenibacillus alkalitolerans]|uniref:hypothetical protein n=1 Tax=Paenibacillus alkalitolerans TaxID=2799335 RepID=UPI0018F7CBD5|nr:hypothetical protein [Paenibacillus alkalitolerans]